ncbi:MAG: hypothetical protein LBQ54_06825 [Planctomycetaceae bacterium]|nr:hypothetical protein [Planctomycetaceae bacterium]
MRKFKNGKSSPIAASLPTHGRWPPKATCCCTALAFRLRGRPPMDHLSNHSLFVPLEDSSEQRERIIVWSGEHAVPSQ